MDDLPPPPYTPNELSAAETGHVSPNVAAQPVQTSLRGGYMRPSLSSKEPSISSAAVYFAERPPFLQNPGPHLNLVEHHITFTPHTIRHDILFPLPIETYIARDVSSMDWSTFVNYLFPVTIEASSEKPKWERDNKAHEFVEEDTLERRKQIQAVVAEWNEHFFSPRLIHINLEFRHALSPSSSRSISYPTVSVQKGYKSQSRRRSHSLSSTSSSSSPSSDSSVDSIKSKDLEGADISGLRSALLAFRLDPNNSANLRLAVRQLRDEFRSQRSQRRDLPSKDRKDLKKEWKDQRKEIKKEVKAVVKEIKFTRKADRKLRKAEKKSRRNGKCAESRGLDRIKSAQDKAQRAQEKTAEHAMRAQQRGLEAQERAAKKAARAQERAAEGYERDREAQARGAAAAWDSEAAAQERAREVVERAQATARDAQSRGWGDAGKDRAKVAEQRAQETARSYSSRAWGGDAQNYGRYGRGRAREAEQRARDIASGPGGRHEADNGQETGVLEN